MKPELAKALTEVEVWLRKHGTHDQESHGSWAADVFDTLEDMAESEDRERSVGGAAYLDAMESGGIPAHRDSAMDMKLDLFPEGEAPVKRGTQEETADSAREYLRTLPDYDEEEWAHEQAVTVFSDGEVMADAVQIGQRDSIPVNRDTMMAQGLSEETSVFLHNHPRNNSFSPGDVLSSVLSRKRRAEAVRPDGQYVLEIDHPSDPQDAADPLKFVAEDVYKDVTSARRAEWGEELTDEQIRYGSGEAMIRIMAEVLPERVTYREEGVSHPEEERWPDSVVEDRAEGLRQILKWQHELDLPPSALPPEGRGDPAPPGSFAKRESAFHTDCMGTRLMEGAVPVVKHGGPGPHSGTGSPQATHASFEVDTSWVTDLMPGDLVRADFDRNDETLWYEVVERKGWPGAYEVRQTNGDAAGNSGTVDLWNMIDKSNLDIGLMRNEDNGRNRPDAGLLADQIMDHAGEGLHVGEGRVRETLGRMPEDRRRSVLEAVAERVDGSDDSDVERSGLVDVLRREFPEDFPMVELEGESADPRARPLGERVAQEMEKRGGFGHGRMVTVHGRAIEMIKAEESQEARLDAVRDIWGWMEMGQRLDEGQVREMLGSDAPPELWEPKRPDQSRTFEDNVQGDVAALISSGDVRVNSLAGVETESVSFSRNARNLLANRAADQEMDRIETIMAVRDAVQAEVDGPAVISTADLDRIVKSVDPSGGAEFGMHRQWLVASGNERRWWLENGAEFVEFDTDNREAHWSAMGEELVKGVDRESSQQNLKWAVQGAGSPGAWEIRGEQETVLVEPEDGFEADMEQLAEETVAEGLPDPVDALSRWDRAHGGESYLRALIEQKRASERERRMASGEALEESIADLDPLLLHSAPGGDEDYGTTVALDRDTRVQLMAELGAIEDEDRRAELAMALDRKVADMLTDDAFHDQRWINDFMSHAGVESRWGLLSIIPADQHANVQQVDMEGERSLDSLVGEVEVGSLREAWALVNYHTNSHRSKRDAWRLMARAGDADARQTVARSGLVNGEDWKVEAAVENGADIAPLMAEQMAASAVPSKRMDDWIWMLEQHSDTGMQDALDVAADPRVSSGRSLYRWLSRVERRHGGRDGFIEAVDNAGLESDKRRVMQAVIEDVPPDSLFGVPEGNADFETGRVKARRLDASVAEYLLGRMEPDSRVARGMAAELAEGQPESVQEQIHEARRQHLEVQGPAVSRRDRVRQWYKTAFDMGDDPDRVEGLIRERAEEWAERWDEDEEELRLELAGRAANKVASRDSEEWADRFDASPDMLMSRASGGRRFFDGQTAPLIVEEGGDSRLDYRLGVSVVRSSESREEVAEALMERTGQGRGEGYMYDGALAAMREDGWDDFDIEAVRRQFVEEVATGAIGDGEYLHDVGSGRGDYSQGQIRFRAEVRDEEMGFHEIEDRINEMWTEGEISGRTDARDLIRNAQLGLMEQAGDPESEISDRQRLKNLLHERDWSEAPLPGGVRKPGLAEQRAHRGRVPEDRMLPRGEPVEAISDQIEPAWDSPHPEQEDGSYAERKSRLRDSLENSEIVASWEVGAAQGVEVVAFKDGNYAMRRVDGGTPLGDGYLMEHGATAEFLFSEVAQAVGAGQHVAAMAAEETDDGRLVTYSDYFPDLRTGAGSLPDEVKWLDWLVDNADRHHGNQGLLDDGTGVFIDNALAFGLQHGAGPELTNDRWGLSPPDDLDWGELERALEELLPKFEERGVAHWHDEMLMRVRDAKRRFT